MLMLAVGRWCSYWRKCFIHSFYSLIHSSTLYLLASSPQNKSEAASRMLAWTLWTLHRRYKPGCMCRLLPTVLLDEQLIPVQPSSSSLHRKPASPHRNHDDRDFSQPPGGRVKSIAAQCVTAVAMARQPPPPPTITQPLCSQLPS